MNNVATTMPHSKKRLKDNAMKITQPLQKGTLIKRYKRFLADIQTEDQVLTVHCPNSGSMKGLADTGNPVWISLAENPNRKLSYTLEFIEINGSLVGINTHRPNKIVHEALIQKKISSLSSYTKIQQEVRYGKNSRIDLFLTETGLPNAYVEIKNVTLKEKNTALFPDAVTARGTKHLKELMEMKAQGHRAIMLYLIQREDCQIFSIAKDIDSLYATTLKQAIEAGVEILAYQCNLTPKEILLDKEIEIELGSEE
jgi:sugar fermentation stimulation protein A